MASPDSIIFNISLLLISESFHVEFGLVSWVVMPYLLVEAGFLLVFGKIGDIHELIAGVPLFGTVVVQAIPGRIPDAVAATANISLWISSYPGSIPPLLPVSH
jgi:MFS family permease